MKYLTLIFLLLLSGCETIAYLRERNKPVFVPRETAGTVRRIPSIVDGAPDIIVKCFGSGVFRPCRRVEAKAEDNELSGRI